MSRGLRRHGLPVSSFGLYCSCNGKWLTIQESDFEKVLAIKLPLKDDRRPKLFTSQNSRLQMILRLDNYAACHGWNSLGTRYVVTAYHLISRLFEISDEASLDQAWALRQYFDEARCYLMGREDFVRLLLDAAGREILTRAIEYK